MLTYSINLKERINVIGILGILSIAIILIIKNYVDIPHWVPVPSVFAIFASFFLLFDKYCWKWGILNGAVIQTPNLNGKWRILMRSSRDNYAEEYEGILTITQTWTKIYLFLDGEKAIGKSTMASIEIHTSQSFTLKWEYLAERKPQYAINEYMHYGMTKVFFEKGASEFKGNYYADQSRHSFGPVTLIKVNPINKKDLVSLRE